MHACMQTVHVFLPTLFIRGYNGWKWVNKVKESIWISWCVIPIAAEGDLGSSSACGRCHMFPFTHTFLEKILTKYMIVFPFPRSSFFIKTHWTKKCFFLTFFSNDITAMYIHLCDTMNNALWMRESNSRNPLWRGEGTQLSGLLLTPFTEECCEWPLPPSYCWEVGKQKGMYKCW